MTDLFPADFRLERRRVNGIALNVRYDPVAGPDRPPLLLLHGFPQTHAIWHAVVERLRQRYTLVLPDLRGYGDSDKPDGPPDHSAYSKRTMAQDVFELMHGLGFERFFVCGHDRGGRVAHRLALDHPQAVRALVLLDISPTLTMYERTTMEFAQRYYHWFFLTQPAPLPERLIGADPLFYLRAKVSGWGSGGTRWPNTNAASPTPLQSMRCARTTVPPQRSISRTTAPTPRSASSARCGCCGASAASCTGCSLRWRTGRTNARAKSPAAHSRRATTSRKRRPLF
jgi:pimeloyl-ACP methyl ester carboxylesterase